MGNRGHGDVERVASDDLMHVRRRKRTRVDQGVDTVDCQLRAAETHELLRRAQMRRPQCSNRGFDMHLVKSWPLAMVLFAALFWLHFQEKGCISARDPQQNNNDDDKKPEEA